MIKTLLLSASLLCVSAHAMNVTYISTGEGISLSEVMKYQLCDNGTCHPYFDTLILHDVDIYNANGAAGKDANNAVLEIKPGAQKMLSDQASIKLLHENNIKVLASIVGDHQYAGWSCFTTEEAADKFANSMVSMANQYHLDGIDIDDEYSTCPGNDYSMIMVANAIKNNPNFHGKILTKALYNDSAIFASSYHNMHLADFLNYGWEMSYWSADANDTLQPYLQYGFGKSQLLAGIDYDINVDIAKKVHDTISNGYNGTMFYSLGNHPYTQNLDRINQAVKVQYGDPWHVQYTKLPTCPIQYGEKSGGVYPNCHCSDGFVYVPSTNICKYKIPIH